MSDNTQVTKVELDAILKQNAELMKENARLARDGAVGVAQNDPRGLLRRMATQKKTCVLMFIDGRPVVGYKNRGTATKPTYLYEKPDPTDPKRNILYVDLVLHGKENESLSVSYKEFLDGAEKVRCRIMATEKQEWVINQGITSRKEVDGYRMVELDMDVPVDIKGEIRWLTVEIPDEYALEGGVKEVRIHENYVNINQAAEAQTIELGELETIK